MAVIADPGPGHDVAEARHGREQVRLALPAHRLARDPLAGVGTLPRRSPSISASIIKVADLPVISLATEPSLTPADSSALPSRWISEVRACTVFILYRVRSRTSFSSGDGRQEPRSSPHPDNSASRAQSRASVLCPFSALACAGLITATSSKSRSHSA